MLVLAPDRETHRRLGEQFEHHRVGKTCRAVVRGWLVAEARIDHPLREVDDDYGESDAGREARAAAPVSGRFALVVRQLGWEAG